MKLNIKQKRNVRRQVSKLLGLTAPRHIVFKSKKIYTRKIKHKK